MTDDQEHRTHERRFWRRQIRIAAWLNGITAAGAAVALLGLYLLYLSIVAADDSIVKANRAWLEPITLAITDVPIGKQFEGILGTLNVGHEPAHNVSTYSGIVSADIRPAIQPRMGDDGNLFWKSCQTQVPARGAEVDYPTQNEKPHYMHMYLDSNIWTQTLDNATNTLVWNVCLTYESMGTVHHSAACFFYRQGIGRKDALNSCLSGNYAD